MNGLKKRGGVFGTSEQFSRGQTLVSVSMPSMLQLNKTQGWVEFFHVSPTYTQKDDIMTRHKNWFICNQNRTMLYGVKKDTIVIWVPLNKPCMSFHHNCKSSRLKKWQKISNQCTGAEGSMWGKGPFLKQNFKVLYTSIFFFFNQWKID